MFLPAPHDGRVYVTVGFMGETWPVWTDTPVEHLVVERIVRVRMRDIRLDTETGRDLRNAMALSLSLGLHWRRLNRHYVFVHVSVLSVESDVIEFATESDVEELALEPHEFSSRGTAGRSASRSTDPPAASARVKR